MIPYKRIQLIYILLLPFIFAGCPGSKTLEEGGAYNSDITLHNADYIVREYVAAVDMFTSWADRNPSVVLEDSNLKRLNNTAREQLDGIPEPDEPLVIYFTARDIYTATQHPESRNDLEQSLNALTALTIQLLSALK